MRSSRRLSPELERTEVGPIGYDIIEPLHRTRYRLAANDIVPIRFDLEIEGVAPPAMEERETHISRSRSRIDADIMRFHQSGVARGWVEVDGTRFDIDDELWVGARDRSWGVRYGVGLPPEDLEATPLPEDASGMLRLDARDDDPTGRPSLHTFRLLPTVSRAGVVHRKCPRGNRALRRASQAVSDVVPDLRFRDDNRRLVGGTIVAVLADGTERTYRIDPVSATGFHLGAGLYGGYEGHHQGEWRGELHVDGEHITGCDTIEVAHRIHQHRDSSSGWRISVTVRLGSGPSNPTPSDRILS